MIDDVKTFRASFLKEFYNRENEMCIFSKRNVHFSVFFRGFQARS